MNLIAEIYEVDVNQNYEKSNYFDLQWKLRKAARSVMVKNDEIAVLYVAKNKYHKLPGGGIEHGENIAEALERELLEETGCIANVKNDLGITIEYRYGMSLLQISYVYESILKEDTGKIELTEKEASQGMVLKWVKRSDIIDLFTKDTPLDESGKFISKRDLEILKYFINKSK